MRKPRYRKDKELARGYIPVERNVCGIRIADFDNYLILPPKRFLKKTLGTTQSSNMKEKMRKLKDQPRSSNM